MHKEKKELIELMEYSQALKYGNFTLASGKHSSYYFDGKLLSLNSTTLAAVSRSLINKIWETCNEVQAIGGPELGAVPIIGGMLSYIGILNNIQRYDDEILGFIVRKQPKGHGTNKLVDGPIDNCDSLQVCIIEDVTTTGQSALRAVEIVEKLGHKVRVVACVLDREDGARQLFEDRGITFISLLTAKDVIKKELPVVDWDGDAFKS